MVSCFTLQDEREVLPSSSEATSAVTEAAAATHGIEVAMGFKPVEHPTKPLDNDQPIQCPLPEPSILNVRLTSFNPLEFEW